jgi:hypothetical protein
MLLRVVLVRIEVSEERIVSIIRANTISELGKTIAFELLVIGNIVSNSAILLILMMEAIISSETSILTRATRYHPRRHSSSSHWFVGTSVTDV